MTRVERSIFINAPIETIDAIALDGQRLPDWFAGVEQAEPDDVYPEPGGRVKLVYKAVGVTFTLTMAVLELKRGQFATFRLEGMITGTHHWAHTPEGSGTRTTATFEYEMPGGALGKVVDKLVVERTNSQNLEKSLEALKALAEH
jgi:uncharacterized membrane protein